MAGKKKIPEIRFKGFSGEWEEKTLGCLAEFNPKSNVPETFEYIDLESVVGTELISHRQEHKNSAPSRAQRLAAKGDLFYQTVRPYQKNNYLFLDAYDNYVFSTGYAQLRPACDSIFLLFRVQTDSFVKNVLDRCSGTSYPAINSTDLADIEASICLNNIEQSQIGIFFLNLDSHIALHQRKYDKLTTVKKAMLEKMFPKNGTDVPEIRFKGFSGKWDRLNLGDICIIGDIDHRMPKSVKEGIPYIMTGNFIGDNDLDFENSKRITTEDYEKLSIKIKPEVGDIIFARYASVGTVRYVETQKIFLVSYSCAIIKNNNNTNGKYLFYYLQANEAKRQIELAINTGSQRNIGIDSLEKVNIYFPQKEEQEKISIYLTNLDSLISLQQQQMDKLKNIKKSCLEKMFV